MRIALVTEAWHPQVNGVVTTWSSVIGLWKQAGHDVHVVHPGLFRTVPFPGYPGVRIAVRPAPALTAMLDSLEPDAFHIATEGPLGLGARRYCRRRGLAFTTSYHTQFADYLKKYFSVPRGFTYRYLRWFHNGAAGVAVPTASLRDRLARRGFANLSVWTRGVDPELFKPAGRSAIDAPRPIFLYAGRVAREKNIDAMLAADLPGTKVVMGDGPARAGLQQRFPGARSLGYQPIEAFARYMAAADVLVFPSLTDTFGVVMLEAMACGVPVAAYPVTGPKDVLAAGITGVMRNDLAVACIAALDLDRAACRAYALQWPWQRCADMALDMLVPTRG